MYTKLLKDDYSPTIFVTAGRITSGYPLQLVRVDVVQEKSVDF